MPLAPTPSSSRTADVVGPYEVPVDGPPHKANMPHLYEHPQDAQSVGRAFGFRMFKTIRRRQLPFLLLFITCVMIFLGALSGLGFSESTAVSAAESERHLIETDERFASEFEDKLREMKKLENEWAAKRRSAKDGAWMKANRDQKAIRRQPLAKTPQEKKLMEQQREAEAMVVPSARENSAIPEVEQIDLEVESLE